MPDEVSKTSRHPRDVDRIDKVKRVSLRGEIDAALGLRGVVSVDDFLVVGTNEGSKLHLLHRCEHNSWRLQRKVALAKGGEEVDIEAISYGDGMLYVVGSHASRRRLMNPDHPVSRNRERLLEIRREDARNRLYRLKFNPKNGSVGKAERIDLTKRIARDPLLRAFRCIPSKENGIDIEGIACRNGHLHIGFRGPVLRENNVPVMRLRFESRKRYAIRFLRLDGQGIRDLVAVESGFIVLSGPVNDAPGPYRLWWWDGEDQIIGRDRKVRESVLLGEVSTPGGARAEGLTLLDEKQGNASVLLVYETDTAAQAVRMRLRLPD